MLADGGIALGSQTVLLRGINDDPQAMETLMNHLLRLRVRPYYLLQGDFVKGTNHFRTRIESGVQMIAHLRKNLSGLGVPTYIIDLPEGGGKVAVQPDQVILKSSTEWVVKNNQGSRHSYPQPICGVETQISPKDKT
jgi:lysine 2,3-aminomutase